ncbi:MAG: hypothetical protein Q8911_00305 [Bacillota bacterium]|nr:hypothetical protein [Bacillota bacterium]
MSNMINLGISEDMVKPILEKQIQAAILANMGNPEELIRNVVSTALRQKVDKDGKVSSYSSDNRYDYLDVLVGKTIRKAAEDSLTEWLKENSQMVKALVIQEMNKPERQNSLVGAFAKSVEDSLKCSWRFNCDVRFDKIDD